MLKWQLSLAGKCQLLFGLAVVLILTAALAVPWLRMQKLVDESQEQTARRLADAWLNRMIELGGAPRSANTLVTDPDTAASFRLTLIEREQFDFHTGDDFVSRAVKKFEDIPPGSDVPAERFSVRRDPEGRRFYRYARAVHQSDLERLRTGFAPDLTATQVSDPLRGILLIETFAPWVGRQILINRIYILLAGLLAGALAIVTFWFITTRIILSPVRVLRATAAKVADGDLNIRADINTGDEFEQLSDAFNNMLANLKTSQEKLQALNKQLDLKLGELAQSNVTLFETNRLKNDFLANVSHELRTPLNSIIGFAEVVAEVPEIKIDDKRKRYVENIIRSSRSLLALINDLLDLAKIEAGRMDLHVKPMSISDACEGLAALIRPQAEARKQTVLLKLARELPMVKTDGGKFQQIIFNFLANAVKFTPEAGQIELAAAADVNSDGTVTGVRVAVTDTGPGIPLEAHHLIFEKFRQLDQTHTREYVGTGLGLAISKELARLLEARIELDSDIGRGSTFTLIMPLSLETKTQPLMPGVPPSA